MAGGQLESPGGVFGVDPSQGGLPGLAGSGSAGLPFAAGGLALGVAGAYGQYQAAQGISQSSQNIAALQQQANAINWQQAQLQGRRSSMEVLRNEQRARSLALSNSVNQGAQFGSGLSGGYGQIAGQAGNNLLGIHQGLEFGARQYAVNQSISAQEQQIAKYQGQSSMWQGISGIGGGLTSAGSSITSAMTNPSGNPFAGA